MLGFEEGPDYTFVLGPYEGPTPKWAKQLMDSLGIKDTSQPSPSPRGRPAGDPPQLMLLVRERMMVEAEAYETQHGATAPRYSLPSASGGACVDNDWGGRSGHFLRYQLKLDSPFPALYITLRYARENEVRAMEYYAKVGKDSSDPEVRRLAAEFAAEETEHVEALDDWLARTPRPAAPWSQDPDRSSPT